MANHSWMVYGLLLCGICRMAEARLGKVGNVRNEAKLHQESTARIFSWFAPVDNNGEDPSTFKYRVQYCELNLPDTCRNTSLSSNTNAELTGLKRNTPYSYHIFVFDKSNVTGEVADGPFRTLNRNTCLDTEFTCSNFQCIPSDRNCNGLSDCADGTDETTFASCAPPVTKPSFREGVPTSPKSVKVTWNVIRVLSDRITSYIVENTNTSGQHEVSHPQNSPATTELSQTFNNLLSNRAYSFRVRAKNPAGLGPWSDILTVRTERAEQIGKVGSLNVEGKPYNERTAVIISWLPPVNDNNEDSSMFKYVVEYCELNMETTCRNLTATSNTSAEVSNLKPDFFYNYYVHVFDSQMKAGVSADGFFRTDKRDTCRSNEFACSSGVTQCVPRGQRCDGLVNCRDGSDETTAAQCAPPLNTPTFVEGKTLSSKSVKVTFNVIKAPSDRITVYVVQNLNTSVLMEIPAPRFSPAITNLTTTFRNLQSKRTYHFKVRAKNLAGLGPWSDLLAIDTAKADVGLIGPVENATAFPIQFSETTAVNISWLPPTDLKNNSVDAITYQVNICPEGIQCTVFTVKSDKTFVEVTGLRILTAYDYLVYVFNENDENDPNLVMKKSYHTRARDRCRADNFMCVGSNQCVLRDRLCNGILDCNDGSDESVGALCALPPPVENLFVKNTTSSTVTLQFNPVLQPEHRVRSYRVQNFKTNEVKEVSQGLQAFSPPKVITFSGLNKGTRYTFRAASVNPSGPSVWINVTAITSGPSTGQAANVGHTFKKYEETRTVIINWQPPIELNGNKASELTYMVEYCVLNMATTCKNTSLTSETQMEITGLDKPLYQYRVHVKNVDDIYGETEYKFLRMQKKDSCMPEFYTCVTSNQCILQNRTCDGIATCGDRSDETKDAGCAVPGSIPGELQIASVTKDSITFGFKQVLKRDRATHYEIQLHDKIINTTTVNTVMEDLVALHERNTIFENLISGTTYYIRVRAVNLAGNGPWSEWMNATTILVSPTAKPNPPKADPASSSSIELKFKPNVIAEEYEIEVTDEDDEVTVQTHKVNSRAPQSTIILNGLKSGTTYRIRMRAKNAKGVGPWSDAVQQTVAGEKEITGLTNGEKAGIVMAAVLIIVIAMLIGAYFYRKKSSGGSSISKSGERISNSSSIENGMSNGFENSAYEMEQK